MPTIVAIRTLAARIETAYHHHHAATAVEAAPPRVWSLAARALLNVRGSAPELPIDPALFVACVAPKSGGPAAWRRLVGRRASRGYILGVRAIIRGLRRELVRELRRIEGRVACGQPIEAVLTRPSPDVSPLGRYMAAQRAGRPELAKLLRPQARRQHEACPLYRQAGERLIPRGGYPADDVFALLTAELHSSPGWN